MAATVQRKIPDELTPLGGKKGEDCFAHILPKLKYLPVGILVILNLETSEFLTDPDELRAIEEFHKRYGDVPSRMFRLTEDASGNKQADWVYRC